MLCPSCRSPNDATADICFKCGKGLYALTEGALLNGRYRIISLLGRGGMGIVYKAHDSELEETVAVKVLRSDLAGSEELVRRFRSEIKLARKVSHRNVCRIHEYGRDRHLTFIVMEFIEGIDFKRSIRERGPLPWAEAFEVSIQVCKALAAIHDVGIIHRDLKTTNIMRDAGGIVKLMDFGIAKSFKAGASSATATGLIVGTPEYMSPEQARAEKADARSDIYALGIVIHELFTGEVPFTGDTPLAVLLRHVKEVPPFVTAPTPLLPPALLPTLSQALAKEREDRIPSARAMADAMRQARAECLGIGATPSAPSPMPIIGAVVPDSYPALRDTPQPTPVPTPVSTVVPTAVPIRVETAAGPMTARTSVQPRRGTPDVSRRGRLRWGIASAIGGTLAVIGVFVALNGPRLPPEPSTAVGTAEGKGFVTPVRPAGIDSASIPNARPAGTEESQPRPGTLVPLPPSPGMTLGRTKERGGKAEAAPPRPASATRTPAPAPTAASGPGVSPPHPEATSQAAPPPSAPARPVENATGPTPTPEPRREPAAVPTPAAPSMGQLQVGAKPFAKVSIDEREIGTTPIAAQCRPDHGERAMGAGAGDASQHRAPGARNLARRSLLTEPRVRPFSNAPPTRRSSRPPSS